MAFKLGKVGAVSNYQIKFENIILKKYKNRIVAWYKLGDAAGATTAVDSGTNGYNSVGLAGVTFNQNGISNTADKAASFTGTSGASYVQIESSPGNRFRPTGSLTTFSILCWFKRNGTGSTPTSGTGTGGMPSVEPLVTKGMAESETAGLNLGWFLGLEAIGSTFYLGADYEIGNTPGGANFPTGRNARMIDITCDATTDVFTVRQSVGGAVGTHHWNNGERIRIGGTAVTGVTTGTWYYIINANQAAGTFQLSATLNGAAVNVQTTVTASGLWCNHARNSVVYDHATMSSSWHLAVLTWDGTNLRTYLDGVLAEWEKPTMKPPEATSSQMACIACAATSAGTKSGGFNGLMQHVIIMERPLFDHEIKELYGQGAMPPAPTLPTPQASLLTSTPVFAGTQNTIVVQLTDSIGISDGSVTSDSVVLKRNNVTLTPGVDYTFSYNSASDQITLTSTGANFPSGSYTVTLN